MDKKVTHRFAFRLGKADYAENLNEIDLITLMGDLGYRRPSPKPALVRLRKFVEIVNADASALGGKSLADALAEQMTTVSDALGIDLGVEVRDYFGRQTRNDNAEEGAWEISG